MLVRLKPVKMPPETALLGTSQADSVVDMQSCRNTGRTTTTQMKASVPAFSTPITSFCMSYPARSL